MLRNRTALLPIVLLILPDGLPARSATTPKATPVSQDPWSGRYSVTWIEGSPAAKGAGETQAVLTRAADADPANVSEGPDLSRWRLGGTGGRDDTSLLRRFDLREYDDLGWGPRHAAGGIECLSGSGLFICRAEPGTSVTFGAQGGEKGEVLSTRTGMFGIVLHAGAFELKRLD
jgi:hypothetical protein